MARRSKEKSYRLVGNIRYKGRIVGAGEPIPSGLSQADISAYVKDGKIRETDPQTGLNVEPKSTRETDLNEGQIQSFLAKPARFISSHLARTEFSTETLAKIHTRAERLGAPPHVLSQISAAIDRRAAAR